jgi:hypothetical protein
VCIDEEENDPLLDSNESVIPDIEPESDKPVDHVIFVIHVSVYINFIYDFILTFFTNIGYWTGKMKFIIF